MDLRKMETLIAVSEYGSFSHAARSVNLTQSAVSQQMRDLEDQLGIQLFDRKTRPPTLTRLGKRYVETARTIISTHRTFVSKHCQQQLYGTLIVGAVRSLLSSVLPQAFSHLKHQNPSLVLRAVNSGLMSTALVDEVRKGHLDVAVVVGPPDLSSDIIWRPYAIERYFVIAPPDTKGLTDEELLRSGPYLRFAPHLPGEWKIDREINRRMPNLSAEMELDTFEAVLAMVDAGLGVGIVPALYVDKAHAQKLTIRQFGDSSFFRELGMIYLRKSKKFELISMLHKALVELAPVPTGHPDLGK